MYDSLCERPSTLHTAKARELRELLPLTERESAPMTTPPWYFAATIVVPVVTPPSSLLVIETHYPFFRLMRDGLDRDAYTLADLPCRRRII